MLYKSKNQRKVLAGSLLSILALVVSLFPSYSANAVLSSISLGLSDPQPSATSQYTLTASGFDTGTSIGCIEVDLGTSADGSGAVAGVDTSGSSFASQSITASGTWTVDNTQSANHILRFTNATPVAPQSGSQTAVWGGVVNGNTADTAYYAKITTYTTNACSTPVDTTAVQFIYTTATEVSATVDSTLTFTVGGVASGATCNGATSNVTTTATTVPFGTVTTSTNKVGIQNLNVTTNAGNGYTVATRYSGELSSGANTIDDHTGTNSAPTAFSAAGTEAFGYTTNDASLGTGTANRFTSTPDVWSEYTTSNAEVAYSNAAISNETTCVGHQVGISGTTAAGTYTTDVIYTAIPVY